MKLFRRRQDDPERRYRTWHEGGREAVELALREGLLTQAERDEFAGATEPTDIDRALPILERALHRLEEGRTVPPVMPEWERRSREEKLDAIIELEVQYQRGEHLLAEAEERGDDQARDFMEAKLKVLREIIDEMSAGVV